jgi:hypothetical protein
MLRLGSASLSVRRFTLGPDIILGTRMARDHTTRRAITPQVTATTLLTTPIQDPSIAVTTANVGLRDDTNPDAIMRDAIITDAIGDSRKGGSASAESPIVTPAAIPFSLKAGLPCYSLKRATFQE